MVPGNGLTGRHANGFNKVVVPKLTLNRLVDHLRGSVGRVVVRHTPHGTILSRLPDMSRVKWSPAQKARRKLMQQAADYYRTQMEDPKTAALHRTRAAKKKIPVSSLVMGEYLKLGYAPRTAR